MEEKHWYDERSPDDAPVWFDAETANGWAQGWNAAVEACVAEFKSILAKEQS